MDFGKDKMTSAEMANRLGCTVQAFGKYRRKAEAVYGEMGSPLPMDGRVTVYSPEEIEVILEFVPAQFKAQAENFQPVEVEVIQAETPENAENSGESPENFQATESETENFQPYLKAEFSPESQKYAVPGLVVAPPMQLSHDIAGHRQHLAHLQSVAGQNVGRATALLAQYAQVRAAQTLQNIDATAEALEAAALGKLAQSLNDEVGGQQSEQSE